MDSITNVFFNNPFVQGLILGLVVALFIWIQGMIKNGKITKELMRMKEGLNAQISTSAQNNAQYIRENEEMRKKLASMEMTMATLSQKPKRAELKTLYVYDKAIHLMYARTPGFATAWESVLKEAEQEIAKAESGLIPLMKKVFHPSLSARTETDDGSVETEPDQAGDTA
ncbi:MAG: hypothetical protein CSA35_04575 [Dethiosulfovibrio peptidovorans]|nr:MAG: hypothetical protein CSA35_04575 [Dethiosulfovibrio peptidovorans]